ncbi:hypothetical protein Bbelb_016120 [Branchiostoma belcheri]|nr:hypothetical protein Bbelb_016120 [Branchiostoma belcheri]
MAQCTDIAFAFLCFALGLTQLGQPCHDFCEIKHTGHCEIPETMGTDFNPTVPCAICNVTEQAQENLLECKFPRDLTILHVTGHNSKSDTWLLLKGKENRVRNLIQDYDSLQCSYPPSLLGRKIADVARETNTESLKEIVCPSPEVKVSQQLKCNGAALVCKVFWEQQPKIGWLYPDGKDVWHRVDKCDREFPTSLSHEQGSTLSANSSGLPYMYIGRSTCTLHLSPQDLQRWGEGRFQCIVKSATDKIYASLSLTKASGFSGGKTRKINCGDGTNVESTKASYSQITSGASSSKASPVQLKGTRISYKDPQQDSTTPGVADVWDNVFKSAVNPTTLGTRNSTIIEGTNKTTNNSLQNGTAPGTDDLPYHTAINTITPSRRQETVLTEKTIFLNTFEMIPGQQKDGISTLSYMYITGACLALLLLGGAMAACQKGYKRQQEHRRVPGNAVIVSRDTPLQNSQQPAIGNPATAQPTYEEIPDVSNTDVSPYATTVDMANPMYETTSTEPKGVRSIQDPPPLPNRQTINDPSSQPQGDIPALPPRTHRHINYNPSSQPQGMEAQNIPASPPPNTNRHSNYNASARPQSSDITQMGKIQDLPLQSNRTIPYGASTSQQSSEIPLVHEIPDPTLRSKRHINSTSGSSQPQGLQIPSGEEVPDLPPRSNKYVNSSMPSQQ